MGLISLLVPEDLVEPYLVAVGGVLNHIKPQTPRLVVDRTSGTLNYPIDVLPLESFLDLDRGNYDINGASCWICDVEFLPASPDPPLVPSGFQTPLNAAREPEISRTFGWLGLYRALASMACRVMSMAVSLGFKATDWAANSYLDRSEAARAGLPMLLIR